MAMREAALEEQVITLTSEKADLADYAERVTRELRRYQQAHSVPPANDDDELPLPPWAMNMQMMSPLLFAYEERIAELEAVIDRSMSLAEQAQSLATQNDSLRRELLDKTQQLRSARLTTPQLCGSEGDGTADEINELYRISVEQNEALSQQNQLLKVQLERMQQSILLSQQQSQEVHARAVESARAYSVEEDHAATLVQERSIAERRLQEVTKTLASQTQQHDELQVQLKAAQHELQAQRGNMNMYKKTLKERCTITDDESERLEAELANATKCDKEQRARITQLEKDLAQSTEQLLAAKKVGEASKHLVTQTCDVNEALERRLREVTEKYEQSQAKLGEASSRVDTLVLEQERWLSVEQALRRQSEKLENRMHNESEILQKQRAQDVDSMQGTCKKQVTSLEERLWKSEQSAIELQASLDLTESRLQWETATQERLTVSRATERTQLQTDLEEVQMAKLRADRSVIVGQKEISRLRAELDAASAEAREFMNRNNSEVAAFRSQRHAAESALGRTRDELVNAENGASNLHREHTHLMAELKEECAKCTDAVEQENRTRKLLRNMERQLSAARSNSRADEQRAVELLRSQQSLQHRWQAEQERETTHLQSQLQRVSAENRLIREKGRGLLQTLTLQRACGTNAASTAEVRGRAFA